MPDFSLSEGPGSRPDVTVVRVSGTFDLATLPRFEELLKRLLESGRVKVVVDLAGLDDVSSSGLGAFLGTLDPFRAKGGDLVFIRLSERVHQIFKVVGFTRLLSIAADESEALALFPGAAAPTQVILCPATDSPHSGEAFDLEVLAADARGMAFEGFRGEATLRASPGIVSPGKIGPFKSGVWRGKVVLTGPGPTSLRVALSGAGAAEGDVLLDLRQTKAPAVLPFTVLCPGCGQAVEIRAFSVYRCKACDETYFVDKWAHCISLKAGRHAGEAASKRISLAFPADVNLLAAVRAFLVSILREQGYPLELVNDVEMAADEAVTNVVEHAYQYDSRKAVHVEMRLDASSVQVKIKDHGSAFDPLKAEPVNLVRHVEERRTGGLGVHLIQALMDHVEYQREDGFNVLTLTKKAEAA